jgi:hypothetical protein
VNANVIALNDARFIVDARRPLKPKYAISAPTVPPSAPNEQAVEKASGGVHCAASA